MKTDNFSQKIGYPLLVMAIFLWIGFVCSISFMEAWVKFRTPNMTLPVGLAIGKVVFAALNKVEWVFAGVIAFITFYRGAGGKRSVLVGIPIAILLIQTFYLLPVLNARADALSQGLSLPQSYGHFYYIFVEVVKVGTLLALGILAIGDLRGKQT
ncbi:hypothetical protein [Estrella lausannensis]|uniref:Conserved putative membrane protein n=1 Tax=Estrella lausannensis TaxID=483423 RepID=A0A0H5DNS2_9BACT|nr:hypothetical protein [Estrella lausannensis]CRX37937.1 Conserved putative membrane protein [Estrella lausannensis]